MINQQCSRNMHLNIFSLSFHAQGKVSYACSYRNYCVFHAESDRTVAVVLWKYSVVSSHIKVFYAPVLIYVSISIGSAINCPLLAKNVFTNVRIHETRRNGLVRYYYFTKFQETKYAGFQIPEILWCYEIILFIFVTFFSFITEHLPRSEETEDSPKRFKSGILHGTDFVMTSVNWYILGSHVLQCNDTIKANAVGKSLLVW